MRFIISPAKKMNVDGDTMEAVGRPVFLERAEVLKGWLQGQSKAVSYTHLDVYKRQVLEWLLE